MSKVIILSGAGISAESGINTFRDAGGLWENNSLEEICSVGCLETNRENTLAFYDDRRIELLDKQPNKAHKKVALLKNKYPNQISIITQNIDNMFEKAGCQDVIHLHGYLSELRCEKCDSIYDIGFKKQNRNSLCKNCQGSLRPNIVFFGEIAPKYQDLIEELDDCEMLVVIGTSGAVINTDMFLGDYLKVSILNNLEPSNYLNEELYTKVIHDKATVAIDEISKDIENFLNKGEIC